jgi:peptidoglycan/xylan/chitin deacetylase (PgdA/CDA1 family)
MSSSDIELRRIRVLGARHRPDLAWAEGLDVVLPARVAERPELFRQGEGGVECLAPPAPLPGLEDEAQALRLRAAFIAAPVASARLPFGYQRVPVRLRDIAAKLLGRCKRSRQDRWARFPLWPLDLSADFLADLLAGPQRQAPAPGPAPVILSHDLDTKEGLDNLLGRFLDLEERHGARSVSFVPARAWPLDLAQLDELTARGHGLGIHGFDHNNRTPFCSPEERRQRLDAARPLIERYGAQGYRAPSLLRTSALLQDLEGLYRYDSSIPSSGGLFPQPNNGCATARPFRIGNIWELPLSMPRDAALWFLGYSPKEILDTWIACAEAIAASRGVITLLTHCEKRFTGKPPLWDVYRDFLDYLASDGRYAFSTPQDARASASSSGVKP